MKGRSCAVLLTAAPATIQPPSLSFARPYGTHRVTSTKGSEGTFRGQIRRADTGRR